MHPSDNRKNTERPSITALVGTVDSHCAKYVATSRIQRGNTEMIKDLQEMCKVNLANTTLTVHLGDG